jgi:hypothetical protein
MATMNDELRQRLELVTIQSRVAGIPLDRERALQVAELTNGNAKALYLALSDDSLEADPAEFYRILRDAAR